jgi:hypothetical protein
MAESADRRDFEVVTAPASAHSNDFRDVARKIAAVDTLDGFLRDMRARYPETGSFVPAPGEETSPQSGLAHPDPAPTGSVSPRLAKRQPTRVASPR